MHCKCPDGFIGYNCETKIEICGQSQHHCLNGGLCVDNDDDYICKCPFDGPMPHAGDHCQYAATEICEGARESFCTNGKCKDITDNTSEDFSTQRHPGCVCDAAFKGEYCEINMKIELIKDLQKDFMWFYVTLFIVTSICFTLLLVYYCLHRGNSDGMVSLPQQEEALDTPEEEVMHTVTIT